MKLITGVIAGFVGYAAWTLSDPGPGEEDDLTTRFYRLRAAWSRAVGEGKAAGDLRRHQMEQEFQDIFNK